MSKLGTALVVLAFALSASVIAGVDRPKREAPIAVEIWRVGDDGLTLKVHQAIESAFRASKSFSIVRAHEGVLVVTIPRNVSWETRKNGTQVLSAVRFSTKGKPIRQIEISCMQNDLSACGTQTLNVAEEIAKTLR